MIYDNSGLPLLALTAIVFILRGLGPLVLQVCLGFWEKEGTQKKNKAIP